MDIFLQKWPIIYNFGYAVFIQVLNLSPSNKYIVIFFFTLLGYCEVVGQKLRFERFTVEDGLQNNIVLAAAEDAKGLLWFATSTGIDRFDGSNFVHYALPQKNSPNSSYGQVPFILTDSKKHLWAASANSIYLYNKKKDVFELPQVINNWLGKNKTVTSFCAGDSGRLLLIGNNNGLGLYNTETEKILTAGKFNQYVRCLFQDNKGLLRAATGKGLRRFVINASSLNELSENLEILAPLYNLQVSGISQDKKGRYWIATLDKGIFVYDEIKKSLTLLPLPEALNRKYAVKDMHHTTNPMQTYVSLDGGGLIRVGENLATTGLYQSNEDDASTLSNNAAYDIFVDTHNRLWVTTYGGGINLVAPEVQPFRNFFHEINNANSLSNNAAKAFTQDGGGNLWFGTRKGLSKLNIATGQWKHFNEESNLPKYTADNVLALESDNKDAIWAGIYGGGIIHINVATGQVRNYIFNAADTTSIGTDYVYALLHDSKERLWAGGIRGSLAYMNTQTRKFTRLATPVSNIYCIMEDSRGDILLGTEKGVFKVTGNTIENMFPKLISEKVNFITEAKPGHYWIGTLGGGLLVINKNKELEKKYKSSDGLPSEVICAIVKDNNEDMWIGTSKGIAHFQTKTSSFTSYSKADGLAGSQVNYGAVFKTNTGEIIFGTTDGFSMFDPLRIRTKGFAPHIVFTGLTVNNKHISATDA